MRFIALAPVRSTGFGDVHAWIFCRVKAGRTGIPLRDLYRRPRRALLIARLSPVRHCPLLERLAPGSSPKAQCVPTGCFLCPNALLPLVRSISSFMRSSLKKLLAQLGRLLATETQMRSHHINVSFSQQQVHDRYSQRAPCASPGLFREL